MEGPAFFVMVSAVAVLMHVSGMLGVRVCSGLVAAVVVAQLACGQGPDEDGESHEHRDPLPAKVTALMFVSVRLFVSFVHLVTLLTFRGRGLGESVHYYTDYDRNDKQ